MSSLPTEATTSIATPSTNSNPKQRLDNTLAQLAMANPQLKNINKDERDISTGELIEPIQRIYEAMRPRGLEFELSDETSRVITRVIDRESGEVIRQIPAEEVLKIAERLEETQGQIISLEA